MSELNLAFEWWYNLSYQQRYAYRKLLKTEKPLQPDQILKLYQLYNNEDVQVQ